MTKTPNAPTRAATTPRPIDKGHIYKLLSNRTYLGELRHKDQWYQAEHPPIVSRELWDSVHAILETNGRVRGNTTRAKVPYLLKGIVFGNDGRALSPWHTTKKNGRRYRYYVPQRDAKEHAGASGLPRLPAAELESAVLDQLRAILRAPNLLGDMLPQAIKLDPTLDEAKITVAMTRLDAIWDQLFPAEQTRIVKLLVEKVIVSPNDLEVRLRANGIERLVLELRPEPVEQQAEARHRARRPRGRPGGDRGGARRETPARIGRSSRAARYQSWLRPRCRAICCGR
ncbi:recombinase family protein [Pseudomonas aeruginosa]|uniref:recombinase family protein n=1 Tax=Pseudomonas aeruginosa TaxID=287 RepID=UPI001F49684E|nr:recombinase family protein [Pseudomonas aeruginosa]